jgi:deoxyribodipyrimidine photo-lyase
VSPDLRIRALNAAPPRRRGFVLYWMTAFRRLGYNFALQRAVDLALERRAPLVILEPLRCGYRWASDRLHRFVIDGMLEHRAALAGSKVLYHPYLEPSPGAGKGLLDALAAKASVVVADDYPCFFLPRMLAAARLDVRLEAVDSNGLLPLAATERVFPSAYVFRRFLQRELKPHLQELPTPHPLDARLAGPAELPAGVRKRWPAADLDRVDLSRFPIDHAVGAAPSKGGSAAARAALKAFDLAGYVERDHPDAEATSGLSPWLHFGHLSAHEVLERLGGPGRFPRRTDGRKGAWGKSAPAEEFLDQLATWRELGFNFCAKRTDYDRYESLPAWARATLEKHAKDPRRTYPLSDLEAARTHDPLWNAAQTQLVREGRLHNYLRMLWGKKILEWTASPREALDVMIELNNKYALDGRDPNSYSGIFWCLGRYDRAWGPERPVFGKVRYMTSASAARKLRLKRYLERWAP